MTVFQMIAKGKDASELFPAVVKNVVSKNLEVMTFMIIMLLFEKLNYYMLGLWIVSMDNSIKNSGSLE